MFTNLLNIKEQLWIVEKDLNQTWFMNRRDAMNLDLGSSLMQYNTRESGAGYVQKFLMFLCAVPPFYGTYK